MNILTITAIISSLLAVLYCFISSRRLKARLDKWKNNSRRIVSAVAEAVIILNNKGRLLYHNPQSRLFFNINPAKPNQQLSEVIRANDVWDIFQQCKNSGQPVTKECSFKINEQVFYSSFKVTAVPFDPPRWRQRPPQKIKTENIALLFYDQTKMKLSKKAHIDFVSNVSHELKTPLTAMQGYVEVLMHDLSLKKLDQFDKFLNILLKNCKRISGLINDLMHLSNLSAKGKIEKKKISTKELTRLVTEDLKTPHHQLNCTFTAPYVEAHPRWAEAALRNLIDNACRHTPEGGVIDILWETAPPYVVLKVRDQGEGVPEKYRQRIFERFFRTDLARSRGMGGTGVGLALVKQSMERQGGRVRVEDSESGGAEFICEFPSP